jgi:hypothetical protein
MENADRNYPSASWRAQKLTALEMEPEIAEMLSRGVEKRLSLR